MVYHQILGGDSLRSRAAFVLRRLGPSCRKTPSFRVFRSPACGYAPPLCVSSQLEA